MLKRKRLFISLLAVSVAATSMIGCSKTKKDDSKKAAASNSYPLKTNVGLTWWTPFSPIAGYGSIKSTNDTDFAKELVKETGVKVKFVNPSGNDATQALNLLIASGDLPDIIETDWYSFPGGPEAPINNGTILKLNDLISKDSPNLKTYLEKNPDLEKAVKTDSGDYYAFPFLRGDDRLTTYLGPVVRQDLLDKLGLQMPTTIDECENVLKKFKEAGIKAPLTFDWNSVTWSNAFVEAFGTKTGLYVEDGKVKFGQAEQGYKDFLALMKKWYDEGLLDKNFATLTGDQKNTAITSGKSAMSIGLTGGGIGLWANNAKQAGNGYKYAGMPYPVLQKGETPKFGQQDSRYTTYNAAAISTKCKNPEIAARVLDYGYSEKGINLYNFGKEGESYTMKDGKPTYTDKVLKNPDGIAISSVLADYTAVGGAPTIQQYGYLTQYLALPEQRSAIKTWKTDMAKYMLPQVSLTSDESSDAASIINSINTYVNEMSFKFIMGTEPLSKFDGYVEQLNKLGLQKYLKYYQDALARYNKR